MSPRSLAVVLVLSAAAQPATAGIYTDDLAKCLVESTTADDRTTLVRWMFAAMSAHPAIETLSRVTPEDRDAANRTLAGIFTQLLTVSCREQAKKAIQFEGASIEASFQVLGQVAGRELFANPAVAQGMSGIDKYLDAAALATLKEGTG